MHIKTVTYLEGTLADALFAPFGQIFALKNIDELSVIDRSCNWLNLATYPTLNSDMKFRYCSDCIKCTWSMQGDVRTLCIGECMGGAYRSALAPRNQQFPRG
jgi:hypothetical protein